MSLYLYGLIRQPEAVDLGPIGFGGEEIRTIPMGTLAAVVGPAPRAVFSNLPKEELVRMLLAHQATLEEVMRRFFVLPFKFGTIVRDESEIHWILENNGRQLAGLLEQMERCLEIDVIATWDVKGMLLEISEEDPDIVKIKNEMARKNQARSAVEGKAPSPPFPRRDGGGDASPYNDADRTLIGMRLADALGHRADDWREKIVSSLKTHTVGQAGHDLLNDSMVLNSSFLILREKEGGFFRAVEEVDNQFKGKLHFKCVGPLPPYSFATVSVKRFNPKEVQVAANVLGFNGKAELAQVKKIYKELSRSAHPDTNPNIPIERFERLNKAYELVADYCKEGARSLETEAIQRYVRLETKGIGFL